MILFDFNMQSVWFCNTANAVGSVAQTQLKLFLTQPSDEEQGNGAFFGWYQSIMLRAVLYLGPCRGYGENPKEYTKIKNKERLWRLVRQ
jgi:hypothetical protein